MSIAAFLETNTGIPWLQRFCSSVLFVSFVKFLHNPSFFVCIFPSDCMPIDQVIKYSELRSSLGTRVRRQSPIPAEPGILLPHSTMYLKVDLIIKKGQDYDVHEPKRRIPFLTLISTFQYPYIYKSKERES